jgi:hypothetical protein
MAVGHFGKDPNFILSFGDYQRRRFISHFPLLKGYETGLIYKGFPTLSTDFKDSSFGLLSTGHIDD